MVKTTAVRTVLRITGPEIDNEPSKLYHS